MAELLVQLPSVQIDNVREDRGDATQGTVLSGNAQPYALATSQTLIVSVDGGLGQTVTFLTVDFDDIAAATAAEVVAVLNRTTGGLTGATASVDSGKVRITSATYGSTSSVQVTGGTATALGFDSSLHSGANFTVLVQLINRIPEDDEYGVPTDTDVELEIHDGDGVAPAASTCDLYVNGTLVYDGDGTGWQTGFSGSTSTPDAATRRFVFGPTGVWDPGTVYTIRVTESGSSLDTSYAFTTTDLISPRLISAEVRSQTVVRLTFNEAVMQVDPGNANDAFNPENYTFACYTIPAVSVTPYEVTPVDAYSVDVTTDIEMSWTATYTVTVENVEDLFGNPIASPDNVATFTTSAQPWPEGRRWQLIEFIPQMNRTEDVTGELTNFILCLQDVCDLVLRSIDAWTDILDVDIAEEKWLDWMLLDLGNPFAFAELEEIDKRRLLRILVDMYREKGTAVGIIDAVRFFLSLEVTINLFNGLGWTLSNESTFDALNPQAVGDPLSSVDEEPTGAATLGPGTQRMLYTFEIVSPRALTDIERKRITDIAELMKPGHTHLLRIVEPALPEEELDHLVLGYSWLGGGTRSGNWKLHASS